MVNNEPGKEVDNNPAIIDQGKQMKVQIDLGTTNEIWRQSGADSLKIENDKEIRYQAVPFSYGSNGEIVQVNNFLIPANIGIGEYGSVKVGKIVPGDDREGEFLILSDVKDNVMPLLKFVKRIEEFNRVIAITHGKENYFDPTKKILIDLPKEK
ncbi:MAG TPA: hypothetical protein VI819_00085 [Patescibacteria group bacterium]|nr:hypothetical protein [Patescibacteria group bacterium]